ncbi:hypothetical protein D3C84_1064750 [compost metagenome]
MPVDFAVPIIQPPIVGGLRRLELPDDLVLDLQALGLELCHCVIAGFGLLGLHDFGIRLRIFVDQ